MGANVRVDVSAVNAMLIAAPDQVLFATSLALNMLGNAAVEKERIGISERFHVRKAWVLKGISLTNKSTKKELTVTIGILPDRAFLAYAELGTPKRLPTHGSRMWVPNQEYFKNKVITKQNPLYPGNLKFDSRGNGPNNTFILLNRSVPLVLQRVNPVAKKKKGRAVNADTGNRLLYTLVKSTRVPMKLRFVQTIEDTVRTQWTHMAADAVARALATAR